VLRSSVAKNRFNRSLSFIFLRHKPVSFIQRKNGLQRVTNARSCRIGDMTAASEAKTPTEPSERQFAGAESSMHKGAVSGCKFECYHSVIYSAAALSCFFFYGAHFFQRMDAVVEHFSGLDLQSRGLP
jgi:hypothetical protein